jgi:hypothetical protein
MNAPPIEGDDPRDRRAFATALASKVFPVSLKQSEKKHRV